MKLDFRCRKYRKKKRTIKSSWIWDILDISSKNTIITYTSKPSTIWQPLRSRFKCNRYVQLLKIIISRYMAHLYVFPLLSYKKSRNVFSSLLFMAQVLSLYSPVSFEVSSKWKTSREERERKRERNRGKFRRFVFEAKRNRHNYLRST